MRQSFNYGLLNRKESVAVYVQDVTKNEELVKNVFRGFCSYQLIQFFS